MESLSGRAIEVKLVDTFNAKNKGIYIAKSGSNSSKGLPIDFSNQLQGQWEKFMVNEHNGSLITGSDTRATVYGIFDVAKRLGISPWKINVLRNFVAVDYPVTFEKSGKQVLRIYVNQTGIVLDQIAVNPQGTPKYYEIPVDDGL